MSQFIRREFSLSALKRQYKEPHHLYDALRAHDRLYFDALNQCWLVTGYQEVTTILEDKRFISEPETFSSAQLLSRNSIHDIIKEQMIFKDGQAHHQEQMIILKHLSRKIKTMQEEMRMIVQTALVPLIKTCTMDAVNDFGNLVSLLVIARVLGMPTHDMEELLQQARWSDAFADVTSGYLRVDMQHIAQLKQYFYKLVEAKRQSPGDDLVSSLVEAKDIFRDDDSLVANCMMIFAAGRVTTKKLLGNGISAMIPDWAHLHASFHDNTRIVKPLTEELLRIVTPTRYVMRQTREDVDLSYLFPGDHYIRRGQKVLLFLEAANYDQVVFTAPDQFDAHRHPNKHLAFGYGSHTCPGAALARSEVQAALEALLHFPHIQQKQSSIPKWNPNPNLGGFVSYLVER